MPKSNTAKTPKSASAPKNPALATRTGGLVDGQTPKGTADTANTAATRTAATATAVTTDKVGTTGSENPAPGAPVVPVRQTVYEATKAREAQLEKDLNAEKKIYVDNVSGEILTDSARATQGATQLVGADAERYEAGRKASAKTEDKAGTRTANKAASKPE